MTNSSPNRFTRRALRIAKRLIAFRSPSHVNNRGISQYLARKFDRYGFVVESLDYDDANGVRKHNIIARKGKGTGGLAYFCHTDTVPADQWSGPTDGPFDPAVIDNRLYGRGACDMKGSIACMLTAVRSLLKTKIEQPFYFVATADEEVGFGGARHVTRNSKLYREIVEGNARAIIGEPTSLEVVYAHKGSTLITATARGRAAHSSTREGRNANLAMIPFLASVAKLFDATESDLVWQDKEFDPPTMCWNLCMSDNRPAVNVTATRSECQIYFRPMPGMDVSPLVEQCKSLAERQGLEFEADAYGQPMRTDPQTEFVLQALRIAGTSNPRTVGYGTDGGVLDKIEDKIVLGPGSIDQAHTDDEWISMEQLLAGVDIYGRFLTAFCQPK